MDTACAEEKKTIEQLLSEGKRILCKMDSSGDKRIAWFPDEPDEIKKAKEEFDDLKAKGWSFFTVGLAGKKEKITKFNADAAQIIAVPPLKGG
jgi:hypothetical protein